MQKRGAANKREKEIVNEEDDDDHHFKPKKKKTRKQLAYDTPIDILLNNKGKWKTNWLCVRMLYISDKWWFARWFLLFCFFCLFVIIMVMINCRVSCVCMWKKGQPIQGVYFFCLLVCVLILITRRTSLVFYAELFFKMQFSSQTPEWSIIFYRISPPKKTTEAEHIQMDPRIRKWWCFRATAKKKTFFWWKTMMRLAIETIEYP